MGKRAMWSEKKIAKRIKEGFGQGCQLGYKPWLTIQDVPSLGVVTRIKGKIVPRTYHLMSQLEYKYFSILEWSDSVIDIREQFPLLERENAIAIADSKGIRYPKYPGTDVPIIMTSDFAIQLIEQDGGVKEVIHSVKPSSELDKPRVIEKLEIERKYWSNKGIEWKVVTEKEMPEALLHNLSIFNGAYYHNEELDIGSLMPILIDELAKRPRHSVVEITKWLDVQKNVDTGTFLSLFRYMVSRKILKLDFTNPINLRILSTDQVSI